VFSCRARLRGVRGWRDGGSNKTEVRDGRPSFEGLFFSFFPRRNTTIANGIPSRASPRCRKFPTTWLTLRAPQHLPSRSNKKRKKRGRPQGPAGLFSFLSRPDGPSGGKRQSTRCPQAEADPRVRDAPTPGATPLVRQERSPPPSRNVTVPSRPVGRARSLGCITAGRSGEVDLRRSPSHPGTVISALQATRFARVGPRLAPFVRRFRATPNNSTLLLQA